MSCLYLKCLERMTGYADIGNEFNHMSAEDEYLFKLSCLPLMIAITKIELESKGVSLEDFDLVSCLARYADLDAPCDKSSAYSLTTSEESLNKCIEKCVIHKGVTIGEIYDGMQNFKEFKALIDVIINIEMGTPKVNLVEASYKDLMVYLFPDISIDSLSNKRPSNVDFDLLSSILIVNLLCEDDRVKKCNINNEDIYLQLHTEVKHIEGNIVNNVVSNFDKLEEAPLLYPKVLDNVLRYSDYLTRIERVKDEVSYKLLINFILYGNNEFIKVYNDTIYSVLRQINVLGDRTHDDMIVASLMTKLVYMYANKHTKSNLSLKEILNVIVDKTNIVDRNYIPYMLATVECDNCEAICLEALNIQGLNINATEKLEKLFRVIEQKYTNNKATCKLEL